MCSQLVGGRCDGPACPRVGTRRLNPRTGGRARCSRAVRGRAAAVRRHPGGEDDGAVVVRTADQQVSGESGQRHRLVGPVDQEQIAAVRAPAHDQLDASPRVVRQLTAHTGRVEQLRQQGGETVRAEPGGDVRGRALARRAPGDGGAVGVRAATVVGQHLHRRVGDADPIGPQGAGGGTVHAVQVDVDRLGVEQRAELLDADAEQLAQGARVAAEPNVVVLVDDAGEVRGDQVAAVLGVPGELLGERGRHDVQDRRDQDLVAVEFGLRGDDVGPDAEGEQRGVPVQRLLPVAELGGGVGVLLARPPRVPVEDDSDPGRLTLGPGDRGEGLEGLSEAGHRAEDLAVGSGVRHHRRVVLLGAGRRLAPLEEAHRVGAVGDVHQRVTGEVARPLGHVDRLPVHGAGGVLHQEPGTATGDAADEVGGEGQLVAVLRAGHHVVVVGDEVDLGGPVRVVHSLGVAHHHEVGGDRNTGRELAQHVPLRAQMVLQHVGGEALEVQLLGGVRVGGGQPRRQDLLPVAVALGPERRAPGVVEGVEGGVAGAQPVAEGAGGVVGVVVDVVAAELVGDVPGDQRGMVRVALGHLPHQAQRVLTEDGRGGTPVLARPGPQRLAGGGDRKDLRVGGAEPGRRGGGGGGQVDPDASRVQQVHDLVEPAEVPLVLGGLDAGPGEDRHGDDVDARLLHEPYVLLPHLSRPLLRVVVGAVREAGVASPSGPCRNWDRRVEIMVVLPVTARGGARYVVASGRPPPSACCSAAAPEEMPVTSRR